MKDVAPYLERFLEHYQKHNLNLRAVVQPRLLEFVKLGTMVLKVIYDKDELEYLTYDEDFSVVKKTFTRFAGPRVVGIHLGDFLFPPFYESIQDCPFVAERQRTTWEKLKELELLGKLANVDAIRNQQTVGKRTIIEEARERVSKHVFRSMFANEIEVYEIWCDYQLHEGEAPSKLVITYHRDTRTILQLRLNWYFHQRKPYVIIPYQTTNDTMYGLGVVEMVKPIQDAITRWHRMAQDNAYLANIRMFIVRKGSGIEEVPRLYAGRCFFVDNPKEDFIPFAASNTYNSTIQERTTLLGFAEKRTGVSDYLVGRQSPIMGTRATATSTLALIREGLARVEEVLENLRAGFEEVIQLVLSLWIQYGTRGLEQIVFGENDEAAAKIREFFSLVSVANVNGAFAVDLTVTDATTNKQARQQAQLALIQIMMQYLEKLLQAGSSAVVAARQGIPEYVEMVKDVMKAAREMFRDLAQQYDVADPDSYLPDLERYLNATGQGFSAGVEGRTVGPEGEQGMGIGAGPFGIPVEPDAESAGARAERDVTAQLTGTSPSVPQGYGTGR
jgi:hypothetical protein